MKTLLEVLNLSTDYLKKLGIQSARRQAEDLLSDALSMKRVNLYMEYDRPLTDEELELCRKRLSRRGKGEPLAYIHGEVEFYGCKLIVTPDVLIPRQETEILVDLIVKELASVDLKDKVLWDICCGSGCIGIAIKKKYPELKVVFSDICPAALRVAHENAKRNAVDAEMVEGDLLDPLLHRKTHYIVCNPPYISASEFLDLDPEVKNNEPKKALVAENGGLACYQKLAEHIPKVLESNGKAWFEIGFKQGEQVSGLFSSYNPKLMKDWAGHDRFVAISLD